MIAQTTQMVYTDTMRAFAVKKIRIRASVGEKPGQTTTTTMLKGTETGLYYYGARYLDPKTSRWISADPAMYDGSYIPSAPIDDEAKKHNQNLPGMGGIFNTVNMHVYHYAGNNPVKLTDPDGRFTKRKEKYPIPSLFAVDEQYVLMPLGGDYTQLQKDINKLVNTLSALTGLLPTGDMVGDIVSAIQNLEEGNYVGLVETAIGIAINSKNSSYGTAFALFQALKEIYSSPVTGATNYTDSQLAFITMVAVEQVFANDLMTKFRNEGVPCEPNYERGFIMNIRVLQPQYSDQIDRIIRETKNSNTLYRDIRIDNE